MKKKPNLTTCDGMRKDGTCGNGYCDNHNKKCRGATCPERFHYEGVGDGSDATGKMPVAPANNYRDRVSNQYAAIETAKDNLLRECVKFGALLTEVSYFLGETQGRKGEGLQAWLAENCPEVNYSTAINYKALATKCVKMIGGGSQAVAALQDKTLVQEPGTGDTIDVDGDFIRKRDELFAEVKSRRELEQTYFDFMAREGKRRPGRPKGSGAGAVEYKKKSALECAVEAVWPTVDHLLKHRGEMFTAYKILPDEKLTQFRDTLMEHVKAISAEIEGRAKR